MKKIFQTTAGSKMVKVYRDTDWQEYRARLYLDGILYAPADYFTDCKADAIDTAAAMVRK